MILSHLLPHLEEVGDEKAAQPTSITVAWQNINLSGTYQQFASNRKTT